MRVGRGADGCDAAGIRQPRHKVGEVTLHHAELQLVVGADVLTAAEGGDPLGERHAIDEIVQQLLLLDVDEGDVLIDQRVEESLKQVAVWDEVKDDLHKSALAFSGGQQQRICIARVLAVHPKVILMDEPTSALDPISSSKIEDTLLKLKNDYSIIIVTHNMQQASRISDRTALLLNGDMIEYNRTEEMFLRPKEKITDDYLNGRFG